MECLIDSPVYFIISALASENGETNRYSTRMKTGRMKPRKYDLDRSFTEEEEEEENVVSEEEESDSFVKSRKISKRKVNTTKQKINLKPKKRGRKRTKPQYKSSRISNKKIILAKVVAKPFKAGQSSSSSSSESSSSTSSSSSSSSNLSEVDSDMEEIGIETENESDATEPNSPVPAVKPSQGTSRKLYCAQSDSDSNNEKHRKRKNVKQKHSSHVSQSSGRKPSRQTRNQGKRTVLYREESDNSENGNNNYYRRHRSHDRHMEESDYSDSQESSVTVSMRGRIRRPTARARAMFD